MKACEDQPFAQETPSSGGSMELPKIIVFKSTGMLGFEGRNFGGTWVIQTLKYFLF